MNQSSVCGGGVCVCRGGGARQSGAKRCGEGVSREGGEVWWWW